MPKRTTSGDVYYYYGVVRFADRNDIEKIKEAISILSKNRVKLNNRDVPAHLMPYNIIAVRKDRVSFMWYAGFWDSDRPVRIYRMTVNLDKRTFNFQVESKFEPAITSRTTYNYLHHKEAFVEGLEAIAINPYGNCMTLERRMKERIDEWVTLPWHPVVLCARDLDELIETLKKLKSKIGRHDVKIIAYVGSFCLKDEFLKNIVTRLSCINV